MDDLDAERQPQSSPESVPMSFSDFVKSKRYVEESIDIEHKFAISEDEKLNSVKRVYFAVNPSGGFSEIALFNKSAMGIELIKMGRKVPIWEKSYYTEEEGVLFLRDSEEYYGTSYSLDYLKGQLELNRVNSVIVNFDSSDVFEYLSTDESTGSIETGQVTRRAEIEKHFSKSQEPFVTANGKVIVENSDDNYIFYLFRRDRIPHHKVVVAKKIDSGLLYEEWEIDKLAANPKQPANGVKGESHGDYEWRHDNFSDKIGVHVIPLENDELDEFDKKGFRELLKRQTHDDQPS